MIGKEQAVQKWDGNKEEMDEDKKPKPEPRNSNFKALVFDCGTGETKGILVEYDVNNGVSLKELSGIKVSLVDFAAADKPFPAGANFLRNTPTEGNMRYAMSEFLFHLHLILVKENFCFVISDHTCY